jgi:menaquinone-dependent protoporphyrinogen oxidase
MTPNNRVLLAYATRHGATAGVAEGIAGALRPLGLVVEVHPAAEVVDLAPYGAVILGSPVYLGKWLPEALRFLKRHRERLRGLPVAFFTVGMMLRDKPEAGQREHEDAIRRARQAVPEVEPLATGMFVGALDKRKLALPLRWLMTLMRAEEGDFRDAEAMRRWAEVLSDKFLVGVDRVDSSGSNS